jgi:CHAT domain-containing protein
VKAGARSALASLWFVNDESTSRLIAEFYRRLADENGKAAALRGAQLLLLNDERYAHPAYWAPFLMIGDWR